MSTYNFCTRQMWALKGHISLPYTQQRVAVPEMPALWWRWTAGISKSRTGGRLIHFTLHLFNFWVFGEGTCMPHLCDSQETTFRSLSLLPPDFLGRGLNLGSQAWWQVPCPWPMEGFLFTWLNSWWDSTLEDFLVQQMSLPRSLRWSWLRQPSFHSLLLRDGRSEVFCLPNQQCLPPQKKFAKKLHNLLSSAFLSCISCFATIILYLSCTHKILPWNLSQLNFIVLSEIL